MLGKNSIYVKSRYLWIFESKMCFSNAMIKHMVKIQSIFPCELFISVGLAWVDNLPNNSFIITASESSSFLFKLQLEILGCRNIFHGDFYILGEFHIEMSKREKVTYIVPQIWR